MFKKGIILLVTGAIVLSSIAKVYMAQEYTELTGALTYGSTTIDTIGITQVTGHEFIENVFGTKGWASGGYGYNNVDYKAAFDGTKGEDTVPTSDTRGAQFFDGEKLGHAGVKFKNPQIITKIGYLARSQTGGTTFQNRLNDAVFEGSNDGNTYEPIYILDNSNINAFVYRSVEDGFERIKPYIYYRVRGNNNNEFNVHELKFYTDAALVDSANTLITNYDQYFFDKFEAQIRNLIPQTVTEETIILKDIIPPYKVTYSSLTPNNMYVEGNTLKITRQSVAQETATVQVLIENEDTQNSQSFQENITLPAIADALETLTITATSPVMGNITLPTSFYGLNLSWQSSHPDVINPNQVGNMPPGVVTRQEQDIDVTLTATIEGDPIAGEKLFPLTVKAKSTGKSEQDMQAYMFVHFVSGNNPDAEQVYFSLSQDGLTWETLNFKKPILKSTLGEGGVRDPHIIRSPEGDKFYLIATDLSIHYNGDWTRAQEAGSKSIMIWESTDLVNWSQQRMIKISRDDAGCTWAPESIYDDQTGEYMLFWASKVGEDNYAKQRIYSARTRDFIEFTQPELYIEKGSHIIDSTFIKNEDIYYRFSKDETTTRVILEKSNSLMGDFTPIESYGLYDASGVALGIEGEKGYEGPTAFKMIKENPDTPDKWWLYIDHYAKNEGYKAFESDDITGGIFKSVQGDFKSDVILRHGTVMPITMDEYKLLKKHYSTEPEEQPILHYNFDSLEANGTILDISGRDNHGIAYNAEIEQGIMKFNGSGKSNESTGTYVKMPDGILARAEKATISMKVKSEVEKKNQFVWCFGNSDSNGYWFLNTSNPSGNLRTAITAGTYTAETELKASHVPANQWASIVAVIDGENSAIYQDGRMVANGRLHMKPYDLGETMQNYIGRSVYGGDDMFKGEIDDFRIYNRELDPSEIWDIAAQHQTVDGAPDITGISQQSLEQYKFIKSYNLEIDCDAKSIIIPVVPGADLTNFEPTFTFVALSPTVTLKSGSFTDGVITVTDQFDNFTDWTIKVVERGNAVLDGYYADPNIIAFDGKYYIYATTDGGSGWNSTSFKAFSSDDLINWKDEGIILDLKDVSWSSGVYAWAPTICRYEGKYYYYYSGTQSIGVAWSDSPTGPFIDKGEALVPSGKYTGQMIDPAAFIDDDGTPYLYWGNQRLYVAKLNKDMMSFDGDVIDITPTANYTEGAFVVKRNGTYYISWSSGDTRHPDYSVYYTKMSDPLNNGQKLDGGTKILSRDNTNHPGIRGVAHHSMFNIPGTDQWYICYHRFNFPQFKDVTTSDSVAGNHREVCIDKLEFDENGDIKVVTATLEGITEPVTRGTYIKDFEIKEGELVYQVETRYTEPTIIYVALFNEFNQLDKISYELSGSFAVTPGKSYSVKVFTWKQDSISPIEYSYQQNFIAE